MSFTTPDPAPGEILESGSGGALPPSRSTPRRGRRRALVGGGVVGGLAVLGAGGWFVYSMFFATGPQPAEALPDSTIGYVSIDLDPSGQQKLEALQTLEKFPGLEDEVNIKDDDDLKQKLFGMAQDAGACPGLSYGDDVQPWLGDRFAVAAVDLGEKNEEGGTEVTPVFVIQVKDASKAEDGLTKLRDCAVEEVVNDSDATADVGGWSISGDWAVLAESDKVAEQVTDAAADAPLSDDASFKKWTNKAGDPGILTAYGSPEAGAFLADQAGFLALSPRSSYACAPTPVQPVAPPESYSSDDESQGEGESSGYESPDYTPECDDEPVSTDDSEESAAIKDALSSFGGGAVTVRFDDGALEVETAADSDLSGLSALTGSDAADVVSTLPDDTAAAFGVGFADGWVDALIDSASTFASPDDIDSFVQTVKQETGLDPDDIEALFGSSATVAVGGDFDPQSDDPSTFPVGVKINGDADPVTAAMDRLLSHLDLPDDFSEIVDYESEGSNVVAGPSQDYRTKLLEDGKLGESDLFKKVVPNADEASSVVFVNFNSFDDLLKDAVGDDQDVIENVTPLAALGISSWTDDDGASHGLLKITTD